MLREKWNIYLPLFQVFLHNRKSQYFSGYDKQDHWEQLRVLIALGLIDEAENILSSLPEEEFIQPEDQFILIVCFLYY